MKHPPYHLRPNKAVDRLTFLDAVRRLDRLAPLKTYTYYGFGGPHLEDFRALYEYCPHIKMFSIEVNEETLKRQQFHLPCGTLKLKNEEFKDFLANYAPNDENSVFWLDNTELEYSLIDQFMSLLQKVSEKSMVKISLRCHPSDFQGKNEEEGEQRKTEFQEKFGALLPSEFEIPRTRAELALLIQNMLQVAAIRALPATVDFRFQPLSSFFYQDTVGMFSLTGIVCRRGKEGQGEIKSAFGDWEFLNSRWARPKEIDLPILSMKERLFLESLLPTKEKQLEKILGYRIGDSEGNNRKLLEQYALYHRFFPHFVKINP